MRVLSVSEFSQYCAAKRPDCYIYATDNQGARVPLPSVKATLRFKEVIISLKPDRICFFNELDKLCFERVKEVQMFDDKPSIGTVFNIVCAERGTDVAYTFIAD